MKKIMKSLMAMSIASCSMLSAMPVVKAAEIPATINADYTTIDESATGSLTIMKYDLTAAIQQGYNPDAYKMYSTGQVMEDVETALKKYALEGVEFGYIKIGDIIQEQTANHIQLKYEVSDEFAQLLEIEPSNDDLYTSETLNHAMQSLLMNNTQGKNMIETYTEGRLTALPETDEGGRTTCEGLPLGLYLVVETKVPQMVESTVDPFLVSLPQTHSEGESWCYDLTVYPKNQSDIPTIDKLVSENGNFEDYTTATTEDRLNYILTSKIPHVTSKATYFTEYTFEDNLKAGIEYNKDVPVSVAFYTSETDAKTNNISNASAVWQVDEGYFSTLYDKTTDGEKMTCTMLAKGLEEINTKHAGKYIVISYAAIMKEDAVLGESGNPNNVSLKWTRSNEAYSETIEDQAIVYSYGLDILKQFDDAKGDMNEVEFVLKNETDGYYVVVEGENGQYFVRGNMNNEVEITNHHIIRPDEEGRIVINGLEADEYTLTEIHTAPGYSLLKDSISINITNTDLVILPSTANITGTTNEHPEVTVTVRNSASATVNGEEVSLKADGTSEKAIAELEIINSKTFLLPRTGGTGMVFCTMAGLMSVSVGAWMMKKTNKKD